MTGEEVKKVVIKYVSYHCINCGFQVVRATSLKSETEEIENIITQHCIENQHNVKGSAMTVEGKLIKLTKDGKSSTKRNFHNIQ